MEGTGFILELEKARGKMEDCKPTSNMDDYTVEDPLIPLTECNSFSSQTDIELRWLQMNSCSPRNRWYWLSSESQVLVSGQPNDQDQLWVTC